MPQERPDEVFLDTSGYVYVARSGPRYYKIGKAKDPKARLKYLDIGPEPIELVHQIASNDATWLERKLHKEFAAKRVRGEWFALSDEDLSRLIGLSQVDRLSHNRRRRSLKSSAPATLLQVPPGGWTLLGLTDTTGKRPKHPRGR